MNISMVAYLLGWILLCEGALMLLPAIVAVIYSEPQCVRAFLIAVALCSLLGIFLIRKKPKTRVFYLREGFVITALSWIVISIFGCLPFIFSGAITDPMSAFFETVSGFTTTGASIVPEVEALPYSINFWRCFTHWIGGMGVLVFLLTLLPLTGASHMNLMKAESPGPQVEKLVPKVQSTAKILYGIYISLTAAQIIFLLFGGMSLFEAATTAFGTAGTGGFGIKNDSLASYSPYIQNTVTVFMILFGVNFNFYFLLLHKKLKRALLMEEVRWYIIIIISSVLVITMSIRHIYPQGIFYAFEQSAFQVSSIITTTGYSTTDFDLWPQLAKAILVMLMFIGACAGSTGGGIKVSRVIIMFKSVKKEIKHLLHPKSVDKISLDGKAVPSSVIHTTNVYVVTFLLLFTLSVLLLCFDGKDLITNFTAVAATINNIGPGLAAVGPTQNFSCFSAGGKLVLIFDMLAGRLELFPLLMIFSKDTWRSF